MRGLVLAAVAVAALATGHAAQADTCVSHMLPFEPHKICVPK